MCPALKGAGALKLEAHLTTTAFGAGTLAALTVAASASGILTTSATAVLAATGVRTASGSRTATAGSVTTSLRSGWRVEVNAGLALLDSLDHGSLSTSACHEVELGLIAKVLKLLTRLPLNPYTGDVLRSELVGILSTLRGEKEREITEVAQTNLLALKQHLTHAVYGDVEDGADVSSRINTTMRGDVLGKLLDGHDVGVLRDGESILLLSLHEFQILWVRILTLLLSLVKVVLLDPKSAWFPI